MADFGAEGFSSVLPHRTSSLIYQRRGSAPTLGSPGPSSQGTYRPPPFDDRLAARDWQGRGGRGLGALVSKLRRPSRRVKLILWTSSLLGLLTLAIMAVVAPHRIPIFRSHIAKRIDVRALDIWTRYVSDHPVDIEARYSWGEMGFRAGIYGELLLRRQDDDVDALDESLWSFVPGIQGLRDSLRLGTGPRFSALQLARPTQGIATVATNQTIGETIQLIGMLREGVKTTLPIEVFHYGEDELHRQLSEALETLPNVRVIDMETQGLFDDERVGFDNLNEERDNARQALALVSTSFQQVVLMRPGVVPLVDPRAFFTERSFISYGSLFFRARDEPQREGPGRLISWLKQQLDRHVPSEEFLASPFWNFETNWMLQPSVMAVDRRRPKVFAALLYNVWLNSRDVRFGSWDLHFPECLTESLWLSFELTGTPINFVAPPPGGLGLFEGDWDDIRRTDLIICPARPVHSLSAGSDGQARPAWIEGPTDSVDQLVRARDAKAWTKHGRWIEVPGKGLCLTSASVEKVEQTLTSGHILDVVGPGQSYLRMFEPLMELKTAA